MKPNLEFRFAAQWDHLKEEKKEERKNHSIEEEGEGKGEKKRSAVERKTLN